MPDIQRSLETFRRAREIIPGGVQLFSRRPELYLEGEYPIYVDRAKGATLWDIDGNEYTDFGMGFGPFCLGYCFDAVDDAVRRQIDRGTVYTLNHPLEVELAELLCEVIPCAEMVRYSKTGGEADAMAIRIARGATGRDKVAFCGYHGWHDWYLAGNLGDGTTLNAHLRPGISPRGVPQGLTGTTIPFEYNNLGSLREALEANRGEVACIIMEASRSEVPAEGFLEGVRELADEHGCVLIFDEVVTGFRLALGGAQELYGVTPDMAVYAKALSNGYPMSAVAGRREVMGGAGDQFISSLYWSDAIGLTAALTTVRYLRDHPVIEHLWRLGGKLKDGFNAMARELGMPIECVGQPPVTSLRFRFEDDAQDQAAYALYVRETLGRGFLGGRIHYITYSHTDENIDRFLEAARHALGAIRAALDAGRLLEAGAPKMRGFGRMV